MEAIVNPFRITSGGGEENAEDTIAATATSISPPSPFGDFRIGSRDQIRKSIAYFFFIVLLFDTILSVGFIILSSITGTSSNSVFSSFPFISTTTTNDSLQCQCPPSLMTNITGEKNTSQGILSDGHRQLSDCRPVWRYGALRKVFLCKFTSPPSNNGDDNNAMRKLQRDTILLKVPTGQSDEFRSAMEDVRHRFRRDHISIGSASANYTENLIRLLDTVLRGSGCVMTSGQFAHLMKERPWIDLAFFARKTEK